MVLKEIIGNHRKSCDTSRWPNLPLGGCSPINICFSPFFSIQCGPKWPCCHVMLSRLLSSRSSSNRKALRQALAFSQALMEELKLITSGRISVDVLGWAIWKVWGWSAGTSDLWEFKRSDQRYCARMFSPHWTTTPMSSVRSCKASCHSDAFSQALSREFMVIKVGCRRLLWISSSKCKFRGQASSWRPWIGTVACLAKSVPLFEGPILVPVHSGSPLWPKSYRIHTKNGCITVWHHCWVVIYSKNRSCKL